MVVAQMSVADFDDAGVAIFTANFGGIDEPSKFSQGKGYSGFYFTDLATKDGSSEEIIDSWPNFCTPNYPRHDFNSRLRAKYFKLQPHRIDGLQRFRYLCWIDARVSIRRYDFVLDTIERLKSLPSNRRLAIFAHPVRNTVKDEFDFIAAGIAAGNRRLMVQYGSENMSGLIEYYEKQGLDLSSRLVAAGFWIRENNEPMNQCWDVWWDHTLKFTIMDQLSLPVIMNKMGIEPELIPGNIYSNDIIKLRKHAKVM